VNAAYGREFAVITGASTGIGRAIARCFARDGYSLVVTAEDAAALAVAAQLFRAAGSPRVEEVVTDLSTADGPRALYDAVAALGIAPDFVVSNAGRGVFGAFTETDLEAELTSIRLNIMATTILTKTYARDMRQRGRGRILITSSLVAFAPSPNLAVYSATKAFNYSLAEAVGNELKGTGVSVTALMPDLTDTEFFEHNGMADTTLGKMPKADVGAVAEAGYAAMMDGANHVVAPASAKVKAAFAHILPSAITSWLARAQAQ
jgi:short-subunit dehydrogenase